MNTQEVKVGRSQFWLLIFCSLALSWTVILSGCGGYQRYVGPGGQAAYPALNPTNHSVNVEGVPVVPGTTFPVPFTSTSDGKRVVDTNALAKELSQPSQLEQLIAVAQAANSSTPTPWQTPVGAGLLIAALVAERWRHGVTTQKLIDTALLVPPPTQPKA